MLFFVCFYYLCELLQRNAVIGKEIVIEYG